MSMFSSKSKPVTASGVTVHGPARAQLDAHLQKMSTIDTERRALNERAGALVADINKADACAKEMKALQDKIDASAVAAVVDGTSCIDLTAEREALTRLQQRHAILAERAEVAVKARAELAATSEALLKNDYKPMQPQLARLCHDAIVERMVTLAPALAEAEARYHTILRRVFLCACACDQLSFANRLGTFHDAQRFTLHVAALPKGEPFDSLCPNRFAVNADYATLQMEAEQLIGKLLRGEGDEPISQA